MHVLKRIGHHFEVTLSNTVKITSGPYSSNNRFLPQHKKQQTVIHEKDIERGGGVVHCYLCDETESNKKKVINQNSLNFECVWHLFFLIISQQSNTKIAQVGF